MAEVLYCCPGSYGDGSPHPFMPALWAGRLGFDVELLSQAPCPDRAIVTPLAVIRARGMKEGGLRFQTGLVTCLLKHRSRSRKCVFYIHGHVCTPAACLALAGVRSCRVIYHTQDYLEPGRHPHWEFFERRLARRAGEVISNERNRARHMMSHYGLKVLPTVVPTLLPKDWPRPERSEAVRRKLLGLFVRPNVVDPVLLMHQGGFAPVRCGEQLVRALALLPENYLLVFTGMVPGSKATRYLNAAAASFGVTDRIVALNRLSFDLMQQYTAACDLGLLLYPNDGVGNFYQAPGRLTQYLVCGLPMVASDFPGLELLFLKHHLGAVANSESPESISAAVRSVGEVGQEELRNWGRKLRELSLNEFSYDRYAGRVEAAIRRAAGCQVT